MLMLEHIIPFFTQILTLYIKKAGGLAIDPNQSMESLFKILEEEINLFARPWEMVNRRNTPF